MTVQKVQFISTYHHGTSMGNYDYHYQIIKKDFRIKSTEIGTKIFDYSIVHPFTNEQELRMPMIRISPDLSIFTSCWEMYNFKLYLNGNK